MLKLYNTLTKSKQEFIPIKKNQVGIYVCGPTVYGPDHLGHARTWIFFDWLRRYFLANNYQVKFVQNITDVGHLVGDAEIGEDKIEKEAKSQKKSPEEIARIYENEHFRDLANLNILKPSFSPRATEHIKEMIDFIQALISKKYAYQANGNVYFDVGSFKEYGQLSGQKIEDLISGTRVKTDSQKRSALDFVLWLKADKNHLQKWFSPWGEGYPGWHIECSVMSAKYLGQPFDIHGSASEHIFPHHENEIAQSITFAGKPLAHFWLHSGMLLINNQKMAKSAGNFITIKDALGRADADTIKIAFMGSHWKKPFNWPASARAGRDGQESAPKEARIIKERMARALEQAQPLKTGFKREINEALEDDFNVPKALSIIMANISKLSLDDFDYIKKIFGLDLTLDVHLSKKQEKMIKEREFARDKGDYKEADRIRKELEKEGKILEDTPTGPRILMDSTITHHQV